MVCRLLVWPAASNATRMALLNAARFKGALVQIQRPDF
jgi:hypothetical protein